MKRWDHLIGPSHHYAISDVLLRQHRNAIIIGFVENTEKLLGLVLGDTPSPLGCGRVGVGCVTSRRVQSSDAEYLATPPGRGPAPCRPAPVATQLPRRTHLPSRGVPTVNTTTAATDTVNLTTAATMMNMAVSSAADTVSGDRD